MSDTSKWELIEEARRAIHAAIPGSGDYEDWIEAIPRGLDLLGDVARAALAVFEQAHTPSDDEREALSNFLFSVYEHGSQPNALREADAILGFLQSRRTAVQEPSEDHEGHEFRDRRLGCIEGEPTDAQVQAAHEAFWASGDVTGGPDAIRAVLRAAAIGQEEKR